MLNELHMVFLFFLRGQNPQRFVVGICCGKFVTRIIVNSRIYNIFRRDVLVKQRNIIKEINNLKRMLVAGYLIEKCSDAAR